jgi:hypothetical protein
MEYRFSKVCKPTTLYQEIVATFPGLEHDVEMELRVERVTDCVMHFDDAGVTINIPEWFDAVVLAAVVEAHDPSALSSQEADAEAERSEREVRLAAMRLRVEGLVGRDVLTLTEGERWLLVAGALTKMHVLNASGTVNPVERWR